MITVSSLSTSLGTFDTVFLLNDQPDWSFEPQLTFSLVSQTEIGLSGRMTRRPQAATIRCGMKLALTLQGIAARQVANFLRTWVNEPVAIPAWPLAVRWADRASRPVTAGLYIVWKDDWSNYAIYESSEPGWPAADDLVAPLLWGRLEKREGQWLSADVFGASIEFSESSDPAWAMVPASATFTSGPAPSGSWGTNPKVLGFQINFDQLDHSVTLDTVIRTQIGFNRAPHEALYPSGDVPFTSRATGVSVCTTSQAAVGQALRFFYDHGLGAAFWVPSYQNAAVLTAQLSAAGTVVIVSDTVDIKTGDWLAFISPGTMRAIGWAKVNSTTATTITLAAAVGSIQPIDDTLICHFYLAHFAKPELQLTFSSREVAELKFDVEETPTEIAPAADETLGVTLGALKARAYLYEFSQFGSIIERWTSCDKTLLDTGTATFVANKISHGDIRQGLYLDQDEVDLITDGLKPDGSAMEILNMVMGVSEAPLFLAIRQEEIDPATGKVPATPTYIFNGEIVQAPAKGGVITAKCSPGGSMFDRKIPRMRLQLDCNYVLFSPPCTLLQTDWKFSCVAGTPPASYPWALNVTSLARVSGATPTYFTNWFAGGWAQFGNQLRMILACTNPSGALTINLDRPFVGLTNGTTIFLFPGCDGRAVTCKEYDATTNPEGKFNNYPNFGGYPFTPGSNPSMVLVPQGAGGGKK